MRADSKLTEAAKVEQTKVHHEAVHGSRCARVLNLLGHAHTPLSLVTLGLLPKCAPVGRSLSSCGENSEAWY